MVDSQRIYAQTQSMNTCYPEKPRWECVTNIEFTAVVKARHRGGRWHFKNMHVKMSSWVILTDGHIRQWAALFGWLSRCGCLCRAEFRPDAPYLDEAELHLQWSGDEAGALRPTIDDNRLWDDFPSAAAVWLTGRKTSELSGSPEIWTTDRHECI